jgi:IS30 family transposase
MKQFTNLNLKDRRRIEILLIKNTPASVIAKQLGFHRSTITREIQRNSSSVNIYSALFAEKRVKKRQRRKKEGKRKLDSNLKLKKYVLKKIQNYHSPNQIVESLKKLYPKDMSMHISEETIYQYIYVLGRGELKKTLIKGLRQQRRYRRRKGLRSKSVDLRGKIEDMLSIHERPKEVADRIIPGHWEGDLILGKRKESALGTLVERTTRQARLVRLKKKDATSVRVAFVRKVKTFPQIFSKSLTYDQGKEMVQHKRFTIDTNMQVYFADPRSPWQRGTNENTNGLIRQFFPKGTDFNQVTGEEIRRVENLLNNRPRKSLGYFTPNEVYFKLLH